MSDIEYKVHIKKYGQLIFVLGTTTIVLGVLILSLPVFAIVNPDFQFQKEFIGYFIFFPIFFMYSMWFVFGFERVIIKEQTIELVKSNRIFTRSTKLAISDIKSIEIVEKKFNSDKWIDFRRERITEKQRAFPFWIGMGQLKVTYKNGKNNTFFNGLSISEAPVMRDSILKELEKRKHDNEL
ncbi:hypothetical protein [Sporocytophaga myxococcoides]|uniref:hypothetical protein n=1 Tax=Sporocytophaga myxococcoides TaxID=153721 RepID=UPI0003F850A9|nr:hypothetical protein [Sporocytophaga myxococcoides]